MSAQRRGNKPSKEPPARPTVADVRATLLDFLELADRCLTGEQRGESPLSAKDYSTFGKVSNALKLIRFAATVRGGGTRRAKDLDPQQMRLGDLRARFNWLCACAARQPCSRTRDLELVVFLFQTVHEAIPELGALPDMVGEAIIQVRRASWGGGGSGSRTVAERIHDHVGYDDERDDWLKPDADWDAPKGKSRNRPGHAAPTAGHLLYELIEQCPNKPRCGYSAASTGDYALRLKRFRPTLGARFVPQNQRLTLLATLLGASRAEAPWLAMRLRLLLQGRDVGALKDQGVADDWSLPAPSDYELPDRAEWWDINREFRRRLLAAGMPDNLDTSLSAFLLAATHLRPEGLWAEGSIPTGTLRPPMPDPWDPERTARIATEEIPKTIFKLRTGPGAMREALIDMAANELISHADVKKARLRDEPEALLVLIEAALAHDGPAPAPGSDTTPADNT